MISVSKHIRYTSVAEECRRRYRSGLFPILVRTLPLPPLRGSGRRVAQTIALCYRRGMTRRVVPDRLRELRKAKGLSTTQLAHAINSSEVTVRTWESGRYSPSAWFLPRLAEVLGADVESFTTNVCSSCGQTIPEGK